MKQGQFFTFEGGEGVGKSTQIKLLAEKLSKLGYLVHITREPGGTDISESIRDILKSSSHIDPITETLLMFAARREHYIKSIKPRLDQGYIVLCDRFYDSSLVYQGILKKISIEQIVMLKNMTLGEFEPDFTLVLDIPSDIAKERVLNRQLCLDDYDMMSEHEFNIIRNGFISIAKTFKFRCKIINAIGNETTVSNRIFKAVQKVLSN